MLKQVDFLGSQEKLKREMEKEINKSKEGKEKKMNESKEGI